jgi:cytosine/adenosine deaminase-related metal-dependent hydrolase
VGQSTDYAIVHVTVINPANSLSQPDMTILIHERAIVSVMPWKGRNLAASTAVINGRGKFVIPGLWDMHVHFRDANRDLKMDIANGVLGIRNMGAVTEEVFPLREAIARGENLGPKIIACGPIVDGPDSWSNSQFTISVKNAKEARMAVASQKK